MYRLQCSFDLRLHCFFGILVCICMEISIVVPGCFLLVVYMQCSVVINDCLLETLQPVKSSRVFLQSELRLETTSEL